MENSVELISVYGVAIGSLIVFAIAGFICNQFTRNSKIPRKSLLNNKLIIHSHLKLMI